MLADRLVDSASPAFWGCPRESAAEDRLQGGRGPGSPSARVGGWRGPAVARPAPPRLRFRNRRVTGRLINEILTAVIDERYLGRRPGDLVGPSRSSQPGTVASCDHGVGVVIRSRLASGPGTDKYMLVMSYDRMVVVGEILTADGEAFSAAITASRSSTTATKAAPDSGTRSRTGEATPPQGAGGGRRTASATVKAPASRHGPPRRRAYYTFRSASARRTRLSCAGREARGPTGARRVRLGLESRCACARTS